MSSQIESLYIEIRTDDRPEEISWQITDEAGKVLISEDSSFVDPQTVYNWEYRVRKEDCLRFDIFDSGGNGISNPGYYRVRRGNIWLQGQVRPFKSNNFHYSGQCDIGESCENPLLVTSNNMYVQSKSEVWFLLQTDENINYNITTCISLDTSSSPVDTRIWIYDGCPSSFSDGPEGALVFNDDYVTCAPGSGVSNYPIRANRDYYIRVQATNAPRNGLLAVSFEDSGEIEGCTDPSSCSYNPFATKEDGSCIYMDSCKPDLEISQEEFSRSIYLDSLVVEDFCLLEEECVTGTGKRDIIRFTTLISNVGDADYIVGNPDVNPIGFSIENCHEHWHRLGYAEYLLFEMGGQPIPLGFKNGFCLLDIACSNENTIPKYTCDYMGISAGCFDIYDSSVECQWLDVTDVPDGNYTMVARINWNQSPDLLNRYESSYENNWAQICINLDRTSGQLKLNILDTCAQYRDCAGVVFGTRLKDCEGICGGPSHFGDMNSDFNLDNEDLKLYLDLFHDGGVEVSTCNDLNGDSLLTVYDFLLLKDCLKDYTDSGTTHDHCIFPKNIIDNESEVGFFIEDHDTENKSVTLSYTSNADISAAHLKIEGIGRILNLINLRDEQDYITTNFKNEIIWISDNTPYSSSEEGTTFISFTYDSIFSNSICIDEIIDVINSVNQRIMKVKNLSECNMLTSTEEIFPLNSIHVYPNPTANILQISTDEEIDTWHLYNSSGKLELHREFDSNVIDLNHLQRGIYLLIIKSNGERTVRKVVKQ